MKVKVTIQHSNGRCLKHVGKVDLDGDLLRVVGAAMEAYRQKHQDLPLFDHSTIKIERS